MVDVLLPILAAGFGVAVVAFVRWYGLSTPLPFSRNSADPEQNKNSTH
jgi:hypothetical protein